MNNIVNQIPLKQGLKLTGRITTGVAMMLIVNQIPLKQGLKLYDKYNSLISVTNCKPNSIKTRIEKKGVKMIFKDIITRVTFEKIWECLLNEYPNQKDLKNTYHKIYKKLIIEDEIKNEDNIYILIKKIKKDNELYNDVSGYIPKESNLFALEFEPWDKWLGYYIHEETLMNYNYEEIVTHCLWEMTFIDFDEDAINNKSCELNNIVEEVEFKLKNNIDLKTKSLKDVLTDLKRGD